MLKVIFRNRFFLNTLQNNGIIYHLITLKRVNEFNVLYNNRNCICHFSNTVVPEPLESHSTLPQSHHHHHRHFSISSTQYAKEIEAEDGEPMGKGDKILKTKLATTRLDAILKAGLGISRSKIEKAFYDDRIRLNGERAKKKSEVLEEGDEIDVIRGTNKLNPLFIDINRVEIIDVRHSTTTVGSKNPEKDEDFSDDDDEQSDKINVVLKRYKNLTIQNYQIPWKGGVADDSK